MLFNIGLFGRLMQKNASSCGLFCQTPGRTPQVMYDAGRISAWIFDCSSKNGECRENEIIKVGCLFTFLIDDNISCHSQAEKVQPMSWKNLHMLEFCFFYMELNVTD